MPAMSSGSGLTSLDQLLAEVENVLADGGQEPAPTAVGLEIDKLLASVTNPVGEVCMTNVAAF